MRAFDIIKKKRDGIELSKEEIDFIIGEYSKGNIPDYQMSAFLMSVYFKKMSLNEITYLTLAMRDSGKKLDFKKIKGIRVDKHSSGGVGDKTSLIISPIVASLGIKVAKMSGRGLGHTGGTIDKLESIKGFNTSLPINKFIDIVNKTNIAIVGQSNELAPADKKLYALRDVTATIDSLPLIASSIMSKKLAADDDCILLDVKCGSGAFMKNLKDAKELAKIMVGIGKNANKKMMALITNMDIPLGNAIGNSLEVIEAIECLKNNGPKDLMSICITLATNMLYLANKGSLKECEKLVIDSIKSGKALNKFKEMVKAQGGDISLIDDYKKFKQAKYKKEIKAKENGYIESVNTEGYGIASLLLGAGRNKIDDKIDFSAGIILNKKVGDAIKKGDCIATLYSDSLEKIKLSEFKFLESTKISKAKPIKQKLILGKII